MVKAVRLRRTTRQPHFTRRLQQRVGADDIGFDKRIRAGNRAIHMALRGKVHHGIDTVLAQRLQYPLVIANVRVHETEVRVVLQRSKVGAVAGIGECVVRHHLVVGMLLHPIVHKVGADKTGCSGDQ
jgi:hypothetical protein